MGEFDFEYSFVRGGVGERSSSSLGQYGLLLFQIFVYVFRQCFGCGVVLVFFYLCLNFLVIFNFLVKIYKYVVFYGEYKDIVRLGLIFCILIFLLKILKYCLGRIVVLKFQFIISKEVVESDSQFQKYENWEGILK